MIELLGPLSEQRVGAFFLVLARLTPLFLMAPLLSSKFLPAQVRGLAAVVLAAAISPVVLGNEHLPTDLIGLGGLIVKELMVGLAFALAVSAVTHALTIAGTILDTVAGFSFGAVLDPINGNNAAILSQLYGVVAVMIFVTVGGDDLMLSGLVKTYDAVPLTAAPALGPLVSGTIAALSAMFLAALQVAAPVLLALVVTDAGFGVVSKVVPQLNIFAVGFPAKLLVTFGIIIASLPFTVGFISGSVPNAIHHAVDAIRHK